METGYIHPPFVHSIIIKHLRARIREEHLEKCVKNLHVQILN
jgi:hypothetical protein